MSTPEQRFVWTGRIRFVDTDASGRIHYSSIFRHVEAAESEFLRALGHSYSVRERVDLDYPRVHVECDYLVPLRYDDAYAIEVTVARVGTTSYTLAFTVTAAERTAAQAKIAVVCIDRATGRPHPLPDSLADALRQHPASQGVEPTNEQGSRHGD